MEAEQVMEQQQAMSNSREVDRRSEEVTVTN